MLPLQSASIIRDRWWEAFSFMAHPPPSLSKASFTVTELILLLPTHPSSTTSTIRGRSSGLGADSPPRAISTAAAPLHRSTTPWRIPLLELPHGHQQRRADRRDLFR